MRIPAIKVNQWLPQWDDYQFPPEFRQNKPNSYFLVASVPVSTLRRLSDVPRRGQATATGRQRAVGPRVEDIGIQRGLEERRVNEIRAFIDAGYPWATLSNKDKEQYPELKKPGWLPTSLVANIVKPTTKRGRRIPNTEDLIEIEQVNNELVNLILPSNAESPSWERKGPISPLEIIDGQHRLLAFDEDEVDGEGFDLPVVFFEDLDISWQAYLFWTINISPKRIGPSLAYDLYPLLRTENWLQPVEGPLAYRETRAQELTEALWSNPASPWYERIGMLGREKGKVTQAAFIRSLTQSFIRRSGRRKDQPAGLFGAPLSEDEDQILPWSRAQQAAYLIFLWSGLEKAIEDSKARWAEHVRKQTRLALPNLLDEEKRDPAFAGRYSLLATDQGVRGFLQVSNDLSVVMSDSLGLTTWDTDEEQDATNKDEVDEALNVFESHPRIASFVRELCEKIAQFDWRSPVTPGLTDLEVGQQAQYRAGSGYREVRRKLLLHLSVHSQGPIRDSASFIIRVMDFDK